MASWLSSLGFWEYVEYSATAIVFVAAAGEYCAEFTKWPERRGVKERLAKASTLVLVMALAGELLGVGRTSQLSSQMIAALEGQAANRDVTLEERTPITARLTRFAGQVAEVVTFPVNFEIDWVADSISALLGDAHWNVRPVARLRSPSLRTGIGLVPHELMVQGVYIQTTGDEPSRTAGRALFEALKSTVTGGIFDPTPLPDPDRPRVWILVGDKPTPLHSWIRK
jgi:hypothetical protein